MKAARAARKIGFDFEASRRPNWIALALAVAGLSSAVTVGYQYVETTRRVEAWSAKLAEVKRMSQRAHSGLSASAREPADLRQEIRYANAVLGQIALPWDALFAQLEASRDKSVALLAIEPDIANRSVRIGGEARSLQAVIDYANRLEGGGVMHDVLLQSHEMKVQDPQRPVAFMLRAAWR